MIRGPGAAVSRRLAVRRQRLQQHIADVAADEARARHDAAPRIEDVDATHIMMQDDKSGDIADLIADWLELHVP